MAEAQNVDLWALSDLARKAGLEVIAAGQQVNYFVVECLPG
jgi:hypothetical protein